MVPPMSRFLISKIPGTFTWRIFRIVLASLVIFQLFLYLYKHPVFSLASIPSLPGIGHLQPYPSCESLQQGLDGLLVVLRTGATEAPRRLLPHFDATLRCVPHYVIYSDLEEDISGHHIYNVLDDVSEEIKATHDDFVYYRHLQEKGRGAFSDDQLQQWRSAQNTEHGRETPGWKLDKWKFLPMAERALKHQPNATWYVFMEGDTYISWQGLLPWLQHFDASKPYYMGMQMQIADVIFAYGGAGFVISKPALEMVVKRREANLKFYDDFTANHWAGDCVLGKALLDAGVNLFWAWPNLSDKSLADMEFGGTDDNARKVWCSHVVSYHHVSPTDVREMYDWEQKWYQNKNDSTIMRNADVFWSYVLPQLEPERVSWDNLSSDERSQNSSVDDCRNICESQPECSQFSVSAPGGICKTSSKLMLGRQLPVSSQGQVTSGWMMDRVASFKKGMEGESCLKTGWVLP